MIWISVLLVFTINSLKIASLNIKVAPNMKWFHFQYLLQLVKKELSHSPLSRSTKKHFTPFQLQCFAIQQLHFSIIKCSPVKFKVAASKPKFCMLPWTLGIKINVSHLLAIKENLWIVDYQIESSFEYSSLFRALIINHFDCF